MATLEREGLSVVIKKGRLSKKIPVHSLRIIERNNRIFFLNDGSVILALKPTELTGNPKELVTQLFNVKGDRGEDGNSISVKLSQEGVIIIDADGKENLVRHGAKGDDGERGQEGSVGEKGEKGERGETGDTGAKGEKGDRGEKGETGDKGEQGEKGDVGQKGDTGAMGIPGLRGLQGIQGADGAKGEKGDKGDVPFTWSGDWERDDYIEGEVVRYTKNGNLYLCIKDTEDEEPPTNEEFWELFLEKGEKGEKGDAGINGLRGPRGRNAGDILTYEGARRMNTTNSYLECDKVFMNESPILITRNLYIDSIAVTTNGVESWTAEIHDDGVLIPGATLTISGADSGYVNNLNVAIDEGAKLMFYVNGNKINKPRIIITLKDR